MQSLVDGGEDWAHWSSARLNRPENGHYLLRIFAREVYGSADEELSRWLGMEQERKLIDEIMREENLSDSYRKFPEVLYEKGVYIRADKEDVKQLCAYLHGRAGPTGRGMPALRLSYTWRRQA